MNRVSYTTFIPEYKIPESSAISPTLLTSMSATPGGSSLSTEGVVPPVITQPIRTATNGTISTAPSWVANYNGIGGTEGNVPNLQAARATLATHQYKGNIDVGNMQEFLDLAAREGVALRVTSGRRAGAKTSKGNRSNHATGDAIDITPVEGQSWDDMIAAIKGSPALMAYMRDKKMRILDERSPEVLARTGGTGAHFHISFGKTEGKSAAEFFV